MSNAFCLPPAERATAPMIIRRGGKSKEICKFRFDNLAHPLDFPHIFCFLYIIGFAFELFQQSLTRRNGTFSDYFRQNLTIWHTPLTASEEKV